MLEITRYIKELLFLHDCVILPEFGGFVANYRSARIDKIQNVFLPPSKDIGFNRNLTQNDGLLINRLAEAEGVSYSDARKSVSFFVEDLWVRINRGEHVTLEGIGYFLYDKRHNLLFEPVKGANFLVDAYGMSDVDMPIAELSLPQRSFGSFMDVEQMRNLFSFGRVRYAVMGLSALVVLALLPLKLEQEGGMQFSSLNPVEVLDVTSVHDDYTNKARISDPAEIVQYEPQVDVLNTKKYYLIAGSFKNLDNARGVVQELRERNYPARMVRNNNLYSVAFNVFDSYYDADIFKRGVIAQDPDMSCWILKR